jgi:hypothetical protein
MMIRQIADEGRNTAIEIGSKYAFMNSGIGAKLADAERTNFSDWIDALDEAPDHTYSWTDGQGRAHSVRVLVTIDEVETYKLKTTVMPWPVEVALLLGLTNVGAIFTYGAAAAFDGVACACQSCCNNPWTAAVCCPCWVAMCAAAMAAYYANIALSIIKITRLIYIIATLLVAWAGLLPGPTISSTGGGADMLLSICWIEDIEHNRKVRVDTWQKHEGANLGLWGTNYPETYSYSVVDFRGNGKIYPPVLRHDSSIVQTDILH